MPPNLQLFAIGFVPKAPALLSLCSSGYVVCEILRSKERRSRLYHRIVLWMNVATSIMAGCHFVGTWAMPYGTPGSMGALGNDLTCKIQGALLTCPGFSVTAYYASLSVISYVAVKNDFKDRHHRHIEPLIHFISVGIPFILALIGLRYNYFNPAGAWCWVDHLPSGCDHDPNVECIHQVESFYKILLIAAMYSLTILTLVMMILIYIKIRKDESSVESSNQGADERNHDHQKKSKIVLLQISLYVLSYVFTYVLIMMSRMIQWATGELNIALYSAAIFLVASQGFFNMIVYIMLRNSAKYRFGVNEGRSSSSPGEGSQEEEQATNDSTVISASQDNSRYEFSIFEGIRPSPQIWNGGNTVIPVANVSYVNEEAEELDEA